MDFQTFWGVENKFGQKVYYKTKAQAEAAAIAIRSRSGSDFSPYIYQEELYFAPKDLGPDVIEKKDLLKKDIDTVVQLGAKPPGKPDSLGIVRPNWGTSLHLHKEERVN